MREREMADNGFVEKAVTGEVDCEEKKKTDGNGFGEKMGTGTREMDSEEKGKEMTPWEQHSSVISIPRFDYEAPAAILGHSHSGFLVTCTIKREKSATKEAIAILEKHINVKGNTDSLKHLLPPDINLGLKRRKLCNPCEERVVEDSKDSETNDGKDTLHVAGNSLCENSLGASACSSAENIFPLSLVKLTRSGLLLFTVARSVPIHNVDILADILRSLDSGDQKPPIWCHRILPFQGTCMLIETDLTMVVSRLVEQYIGSEKHIFERPLKFAVAFNRRGIEEMEIKQKNYQDSALLDRNKCLRVVASAVKVIVSDSVVDLKSPQMAVLIEVLPISGVPNGSLVVAVAVLPYSLVNSKPRLCVKPLTAGQKGMKRK